MFSNTLLVSSAVLLASISAVKADSDVFGLVSIRSGSALQYASVLIDTDNGSDGYYPINVGSGNELNWEYVITDEGYLIANATYYWGIIPNSNGQYGATKDLSKAVDGFSIADGNLASSKDYSFEAVPDGSSWDLYSQNSAGKNGNTANNLGLALACYTTNGFASDYSPSSSSLDSSLDSSSNSSATTLVPEDNSTATTLVPVDNSTATTLAPVNNSTSALPIHNSTTVAPPVVTSVLSTSVSDTSTKIITSTTSVSQNSTSNSTNSTSKGNSSSSQKNGADAIKGSVSLLIMGFAGLFL